MQTEKDEKTNHQTSALSDEEIILRKQWLELGADDEALIVNEVDKLLDNRVDELMESMYEHFLSFEETRSFFDNEHVLKHAKAAQSDYFRRLTKGKYDQDYVQNRLLVGSTHHRIELDPKWYLGAYNRAFSFVLPLLIERFKEQPAQLSSVISALMKIIFFDMGLAFESYISAKEAAIRKHRDAIRELDTERRVTKSTLEGAPIGIVSLSPEFICLECNDEFVKFLDVDGRQAVIGQSLFKLAPYLKRSLFEELLKSGQPYRRSADLLCLSQSQLSDEAYWDWAAWPVKNDAGSIVNVVATFANATDRVILQQQREDFVAMLTHDLKTPVLATNRAVQFLLEGDFGPLAEEQRELLATVLQSNTALYSLVQTLLDVYRFDSGAKELTIKNCNLAAVITQMVTEVMPLAQAKRVELQASLPGDAVDVQCDEAEVRRVIQNLLDNSLKFTPSGGSIRVSMKQVDEKTVISVKDTGRGVPEENKPKLFQRFWQAGSTGRHYASTGLGLYLCRRIIEGHGGKIWCESTVGAGSTFFFEI